MKEIFFKKSSNVLILFLTIIMYLTLVYIFYPGFYSYDSIYQLIQAKENAYIDSHPPIMAILWNFLMKFYSNPATLLFLQLGILFVAITYSALHKNNKGMRRRVGFILVIPFLPFVINFSGVIWKDILMAYALLLAGVIIIQNTKISNVRLFGVFLLLLFATLIRVNGIFASLPLFLLLFYKYFGGKSYSRIIIVTFISIIISFNVSNLLISKNYKIEKSNIGNLYFVNEIYLYSLKEGRSLIPGVKFEDIKSCENVVIADSNQIARIMCLQPLGYQFDSKTPNLSPIFFKSFLNDPQSYFEFRNHKFLNYLRIGNKEPWYYWHNRISENGINLSFSDKRLTNFVESYVFKTADLLPILFKPYFWISLQILFLIANLSRSNSTHKVAMVALSSSSILYTFSFYPVVDVPDFRYAYWNVLCVLISLIYFEKLVLSRSPTT
jgi:hypothetical protein